MQHVTPPEFDIDDPHSWSLPMDFGIGIGAGVRPLHRLMRHLRRATRRRGRAHAANLQPMSSPQPVAPAEAGAAAG
jgi:hypothetical protein